ncbi:MAG: diguanylate cyclase [Betaproteobacteria bacterium]|nr:diguanylate cyclase [Betaproteobacteria bacterium]
MVPGILRAALWVVAIAASCAALGWAVPSDPAPPIRLAPDTREADMAGRILVLEDPGSTLNLESARKRRNEFVAYPGTADLNFGYRGQTYWLRLPLEVEPGAAREWLIEIAYPPLESVTVYLPDETQLQGGSRVPFSERIVAHRNHVFPFRLQPVGQHREVEILIRVSSQTTGLIPVRLRSSAAFHDYNLESYWAMGLYYGLLFSLGLYNLLLCVALRSAVYGYYVLWVLSLAGGVAALNGVGAQFLWSDSPAANVWSLPVSLLASNACAVLFSRRFLDTPGNFPRFDRLLATLMYVSLAGTLTAVAFPLRWAIQGMSFMALMVTGTLIVLAVLSVRRGVPSAHYYLAAWIVLLVGSFLTAMRNFGWFPNMFISQHGLQLGSACEMLLLSFALAARFNQLKRANEDAQARALDAARRHEAELESRVAERTAELGATNARLAESEAQLRELAHHDPLTGLPNRLRFAEHLQAALARSQRQHASLALMLIDLDGFKPINDRNGHAAGDTVLRAVAARLREGIRAGDFAARIGGDEFVVVLEAPQYLADAVRSGEKLLASLAGPIDFGGLVLHVGASVGLALSHAAQDADELLRQADAAMYRAKSGGRGRVCVHDGGALQDASRPVAVAG